MPPGEYITKGGWGVLHVKAPLQGHSSFDLRTVGGNRHECGLAGVIVGNAATVEVPSDHTLDCTLTFQAHAGTITVRSPTFSNCQSFCGMRAGFQGDYVSPASGCSNAERHFTFATAYSAYEAKLYSTAIDLLSTQLDKCAATMGDVEAAQLRNNLAVVYHHAGDFAACRAMVQPLLTKTAKDQLELLDQVAPGDHEQWLLIDQHASYNLSICADPAR